MTTPASAREQVRRIAHARVTRVMGSAVGTVALFGAPCRILYIQYIRESVDSM